MASTRAFVKIKLKLLEVITLSAGKARNSEMKAALCGRGLMDSRAPRAISPLEVVKPLSHKGFGLVSGTQGGNSPKHRARRRNRRRRSHEGCQWNQRLRRFSARNFDKILARLTTDGWELALAIVAALFGPMNQSGAAAPAGPALTLAAPALCAAALRRDRAAWRIGQRRLGDLAAHAAMRWLEGAGLRSAAHGAARKGCDAPSGPAPARSASRPQGRIGPG